ncbi:MAG: hypothetical protein REI64_14610, partial [Pedobacter sp.]|nr:hypothetical protein [Pedobacter sp.]
MKNILRSITLCVLLCACVQSVNAQVKIGDNPTTINKASILELESSNKGLLFPRVNLTNTTTWGLATGSTPVAGMMVYNIKTIATGFSGTAAYPAHTPDGTGVYYWDGTGWVSLRGLKGDTGAVGQQGVAGATGTQGPIGATGTAGKGITSTIYNPATGIVTITFTDGTSSMTGDLRGAAGATGATGPQGIQGATGADGAVGATGATGPQGATG